MGLVSWFTHHADQAAVYPTLNDWAVKDHQPSADLIPPCPTHAWDDLTHRGGVTMCTCKAETGSC